MAGRGVVVVVSSMLLAKWITIIRSQWLWNFAVHVLDLLANSILFEWLILLKR